MVNDVSEKQCPFCGETIKSVAILCRFCKSDLAGSSTPQLPSTSSSSQPEGVLYETSLHWQIFLAPFFWLVAALCLCAMGLVGALLIPLIFFGRRFCALRTSHFKITGKKVLIQTGLLSRKTIEIPLSQIGTVTVKQSFIDRMTDCGDIELTGAGSSYKPLRALRAPQAFREHLNAALKRTGTR